MADDDNVRGGWLPPRAPGAGEPPRYGSAGEDGPRWQPPAPGEQVPRWTPVEPPPPAAGPQERPGQRPTFVAGGQRDLAATSALTLALISLALLVFSVGAGFWLTLPLSGIALHLGRRARARAEKAQQRAGRSQAQAGYVLGVIGVVLGLIAAIGWIVAISLGYGPTDLQHDLQRELDRQSREALIHAARALIGR